MQAAPWIGVAISLAVALVAALADRRRARRSDPDRVGWVPWPLVFVLGLMVAAVFAAVAIGR